MSDVVIGIKGDSKGLKKEIDGVKKAAKDFQNDLGKIASVGAVAFAGFTGAIAGTVATFRRQEQALLRQDAVLRSTGFAAGLTAQELQKMASGLQSVTTFGDEAVIEAQNLLLTFKEVGSETFPRATETILDVATAMNLDLKSAAIQVGKALNDPTTGLSMLTRVGITFSNAQKEQIKQMQALGDTAGAQSLILQELESQFGGASRSASQGTGTFIQLKNVFGDLLEDVGERFVPVLAKGAKFLKEFFENARENEQFISFAARTLAVGAALTGLITVGATSALVISKLGVAMQVLAIKAGTTRLAVAALTGALTFGIGTVIAFLPEIIEFTKQVGGPLLQGLNSIKNSGAEISNAFKNLFANLINVGGSIGQVIASIFTFDPATISNAVGNARASVQKVIKDGFGDVRKIKQKVTFDFNAADEEKRIAQERAQAEEQAERANQQRRLQRVQEQQAEIRAQKLEEARIERESMQALQEEFRQLDAIDQELLTQQEIQNLKLRALTREQAEKEVAKNRLKRRVEERNLELKEEVEHGKALAKIRQLQRSAQLTQYRQTTSDLAQLTQSRNNTLKTIGKVGATAQIIINTAQAATGALVSLSPIPIVGPALALIAAAAMIAFGAEQIRNVNAAQQGGIVPGVGSGDKVPMLLEPGEVIVPKRLRPTFDQQFATDKKQDKNTVVNQSFVFEGSIIGEEDFVRNNIIPQIQEAVDFANADIGGSS